MKLARADFTKGKSLDSLLNMNPERFLKLTPSQKRQVVGRLASAANKRVKRAVQAGRESWAIKRAQEEGKFSTAGKSVEGLTEEYNRVRSFMVNPTTTEKGYNSASKEIAERLEEEGYEVTPKEAGRALALYEELATKDKDLISREERYKYLRELTDIVGADTIHDVRNLFNDLGNAIGNIDGQAGTERNESSLSRFFEIE